MTKKKSKPVKRQSNLSRALASSNQQSHVLDRFFSHLSAAEIRRSVALIKRHRHFVDAVELAASGAGMFYAQRGPEIDIEKNLSWCLGVLEVHSQRVQQYLDAQPKILSLILLEKHSELVEEIEILEAEHGISTWGIGLKATALAISDPEKRRAYLGELFRAADDNGFFKAIVFNLVTRFDDPEILPSESKFFEQKIKRSFTGKLLHFLMYKLVPHRVEHVYDFEHILQMERESSHIDVFLCIIDFLIEGLHDPDEKTLQLCKKTIADLNRLFQSDLLEDLYISYGLMPPPLPDRSALDVIDFYTAGDYDEVCRAMEANPDLSRRFAMVEVWAKSLARVPNRMPSGSMGTFLGPLRDLLLKNSNYEKSKALLLAYSHALSSIPWFKELRYLVDRESRFYSPVVNDRLRQTALLVSHFTSPAKSLELSARNQSVSINYSLTNAMPSVTVRLFERMQSESSTVPESSELLGIEDDRKDKFLAMWHSARKQFDLAIPLLLKLRRSSDLRVAHDASKSLVAAYLSANRIEEAADVYVDSVLQNINLLSAFDSTRLCEACESLITSSGSIAIPIVFSIYSRHIGDDFNAALKYSFERFLKNNDLSEPTSIANLAEANYAGERINYFLRYVCTPEVMKLYLYFDSTKEIEQCRVAICKLLIERGVTDEEIVLEVKYRTRYLFLRDATNQVEHSRIYSDANLLTGPSSLTFRALFERYMALRPLDYSASDDEREHAKLVSLVRSDPIVRQSAHSLHVQVVLNEKNSTFLKLLKLVRDEFAFGEKGLNVFLSTRIRHGYFPNAMRKPVKDNYLFMSKVTEAGSYKLNSPWVSTLNLTPAARQILEHALTDFTAKFNALIDQVNDSWLRLFTIDQDISGLTKEGETESSKFNYSVSSLEAFYLQTELDLQSSYSDFVLIATKWLWDRTELNLGIIRKGLSDEVRGKAFALIDELEKTTVQRCALDSLGGFPDAIVRARTGLAQSFDTVNGWFTRSQGGAIPQFELDVAVSIAKLAADANVSFQDNSGVIFDGKYLNSLVDVFYILFENSISKCGVSGTALSIVATCDLTDKGMKISVTNSCSFDSDIASRNKKLDRYRIPAEAAEQFAVGAAQGEGGSGFFKIWRALYKDLNVHHQTSFEFPDPDSFVVRIEIPAAELKKVAVNENTSD